MLHVLHWLHAAQALTMTMILALGVTLTMKMASTYHEDDLGFGCQSRHSLGHQGQAGEDWTGIEAHPLCTGYFRLSTSGLVL
jgi:hypothetical protein